MKLYKLFLISILFLVSVGGVCAAELDNTTDDSGLNPLNSSNTNTTDDSGLNPLNSSNTNTTDAGEILNLLRSELEKRDTIIQNLKLRIQNLEGRMLKNSMLIDELINIVINQTAEIEKLNKIIDNSTEELDRAFIALIEHFHIHSDELSKEITTLKINSVSRNDVVKSLRGLSSTTNIKCGKYTFKLSEYLKIPLIKNGKKNVLKFKKCHGKLPKYIIIAGYKVPQKIYKKLYNL